jgi:nucleotide-binding universal stress UspA family protein
MSAADSNPTSGPIVVGVDGSTNAHRALMVAARLAVALDVPVIAVHALGMMTSIDGRRVPAAEHRDEIETLMHSQWCDVLREMLGDRWSGELVDGNPAVALLGAAADHDASFIVVGARGVGGHPDLMLGSTSHQVIEHAACPAVVVPPIDRGSASDAAEAVRRSLVQ